MSFGIPVRNGLGLGLLASTSLATGNVGFTLPVPTLNLNFTTMTALPSTITFSRPSNATYYDSTGKLTYAPNSLLLYSQDLANAAWAKAVVGTGVAPVATANVGLAPDGTMTATRIQFDLGATPASAGSRISQAATAGIATPISKYVQSAYLKTNDGSTKTLYFLLNNATNFTAITVTPEWQRFVGTYIGAQIQFGLSGPTGFATGVTTSTTADILAWGVQLEAVTYQTTPGTYVATTSAVYYGARLDYNPATLAARGLLIEEARTNLALYSSDFTTGSYTKGNLTSVTKSGTSPDGTTNSLNLITENTANGAHYFYGTSFVLLASTYTFSVYVKAGTQRYISLRGEKYIATPLFAWLTFDTQTQTIDANAGVLSSGYQDCGNGIYRIWLTQTVISNIDGNAVISGSNVATAPVPTSLVGNSYTGTSQTWYAWGLQVELGSFATSYIPTAASSVARSADTASMTGTNFSSWYNQTEGTFVANSETGGVTNAAMVGQATVAAFSPNIDVARYQAGIVGATIFNVSQQSNLTLSPSFVFGQIYKTALAYKLNDVAGVANGGTVQTDTSANIPTVDRLLIGYTDNNYQLNGHLAYLVYYPQRLPNATLQSLTS